ncbi:MAG TPA: hypothetical protein VF412_19300 [Bdellovibrio sp.]|uniref:hypothetical protein n=1 Tax=Bdellovibrio sp. TaxID=28201 RepID=UPI002F01DFAA
MNQLKVKVNLLTALNTFALLAYVVLSLLFVAMLSEEANAKVIYTSEKIETIRIKHTGPTIFRFPKSVQTISGASRFEVKSANPKDSSYSVLSVTPRFAGVSNDVSFILSDGTVVRVKIVAEVNDPLSDSFYDFKSADAKSNERPADRGESSFEVELLKALVSDSAISGYQIIKTSQRMPSKQSGISVELTRIYKGSPYNGYVFLVTNTSWRNDIEVDVRKFTVGDDGLAILSQSDESILKPKGKGTYKTLVRVVAKNTATSNDVVMPMEAEEHKSKTENED